MATAQRVTGLDRAITVVLVLILIGSAVVIAQYGISTIRRHRQKRRAWLRDFGAEARQRDKETQP